jgi:hypothetical protein
MGRCSRFGISNGSDLHRDRKSLDPTQSPTSWWRACEVSYKPLGLPRDSEVDVPRWRGCNQKYPITAAKRKGGAIQMRKLPICSWPAPTMKRATMSPATMPIAGGRLLLLAGGNSGPCQLCPGSPTLSPIRTSSTNCSRSHNRSSADHCHLLTYQLWRIARHEHVTGV